ncbi:CocE/NonD family hydrolase [Luteipulveratus mongoliensis]|uniref:Xaa-Pro dipeptidyl-peptidase C-terminal domain-containing protein n=1 Tax=Luteipulveratus mongoliensis TaxID=571913 RepID=A0A0K1JMB5_9MICO|nr:CocE/NonD family hydrolase [Luteipulveratus mongoliensis]AKU17862.1 hypothetical protein VV02_21690 [Luteipulveratus mongoliensis]
MTGRSLLAVGAVAAAAVSLAAPAPPSHATEPTTVKAGGTTHDQNDRVPEGAAWTESYFPSSGGVTLHADVLRPANLPAGTRTPVILSAGPYFSHRGQTGDDGFTHTGPSERFNDFVDGAKLMARGYTVVMVDLRGFGGSTGCLDWVGPGEQADVAAAVTWARTQPWSTGKVGMYGKSYDASTGLVGATLKKRGPDAVVAQEPVWDMYNYLFNNGVPRFNHLGTPEAYNEIATISGMSDDSAQYKKAADYETQNPKCLKDNLTDTQNPSPRSSYWRARDLAAKVTGSHTPLFVTQGTIEDNTKAEDVQQFLANHHGPQRGWVGPWPHVRGNDAVDGTLLMGRAGWFDEVMRFYDRYLKGDKPTVKDPTFAVQDNSGTWRGQKTWPLTSRHTNVGLATGTYVDTGAAGGFNPEKRAQASGQYDMEHLGSVAPRPSVRSFAKTAAGSLTTYSTPVTAKVRLTGTPSVDLITKGRGNLVAELWDVAADGSAVQLNDMITVVPAVGVTHLNLRGMDWTLQPGHRLAVRVGTNHADGYWEPSSSKAAVKVWTARLTLPLQNPTTDVATQGDRAPYLDEYLDSYASTSPVTPGPGTFTLRP